MRKVLLVVVLAILALGAVVAFRTARLRSSAPAVEPAPRVAVDPAAAERLADAVRVPTVSDGADSPPRAEEFAAFHAHLEEAFPRVHAALERETVAGWSLLYRWEGAEPSLPPLLLLSHMDVVPVEPGTEGNWTQPPFGGVIAGGFVWGRGTLDDKVGVLGILEAVEAELAAGFAPRRTVLLAFGHDEEEGGAGAAETARRLESRGVRPHLVLDEGGIIAEGLVPGVEPPVALIKVTEKGYVSLELVVTAEGGHSSMPPPETAVGILARAITRIEENPFPARLGAVSRNFFQRLAPEMGLGARVAFANLWLTEPLVERRLLTTPATAASVRTTIAPTMLEGSPKDNVLASRARGVVNFRILPGDSVAGVVEHVRRAVDDERVAIQPLEPTVEPAPVAPTEGEAFEALVRTVREVFPGVLVAPNLSVGATDSRHFTGLTPHVYGFIPVPVGPADLARVHGIDERLAVEAYDDAIRFYRRLLRNVG